MLNDWKQYIPHKALWFRITLDSLVGGWLKNSAARRMEFIESFANTTKEFSCKFLQLDRYFRRTGTEEDSCIGRQILEMMYWLAILGGWDHIYVVIFKKQ